MDKKMLYEWIDNELYDCLSDFEKRYKTDIESGNFLDRKSVFVGAAALKYFLMNNESLEMEYKPTYDNYFSSDGFSLDFYEFFCDVTYGRIEKEYMEDPFIRSSLRLLTECLYNKMSKTEKE